MDLDEELPVPDPSDEEVEDGQDKDLIPKKQFLAAIKSANQKYDSLKASFDALKVAADNKPAPAQPSPQAVQTRFTRAQLNGMTTAGQITQEQADAQMEYQMREDAVAEARRVTAETLSADKRRGFVDAEIARYAALAPEIMDEANETRAKIKTEYKFLVESMGDTNSVDTQLKAIRAVLGPVANLELARSGKNSHESHKETGGGGGGGGKPEDKIGVSLTSREKAYYQKRIDNGLYKDWAAVKDVMKYAKPELRRRNGATT